MVLRGTKTKPVTRARFQEFQKLLKLKKNADKNNELVAYSEHESYSLLEK